MNKINLYEKVGVEDERSDEEELVESSGVDNSSWTIKDYQVTILFVLVYFGDGVELYLPGIITQVVASELGVSSLKEGFLGIIIYATIIVTIIGSWALKGTFGKRMIIIFSLYISIISAILCALVPNYYTLLLARAMTGICVGLNSSTIGVFFSEQVSHNKVYSIGTSLSSVAVPLGAGWGSVLSYLIMEALGWRVFVVAASVPLFIPPLILLHFFLDSKDDKKEKTTNWTEEIVVPNPGIRNLKNCAMSFLCCLQGYGGVILLPVLLRAGNEEKTGIVGNSAVQGSQFLILAAVHGGANLIGRIAGFSLNGRIRFSNLQPIIALGTVLCYGLLLFSPGILGTSVIMGVAKILYSMANFALTLMAFDPHYNGTANLGAFATCSSTAAFCGGIVGTALASFTAPYTAVFCTFVSSCILVGVICSITERD